MYVKGGAIILADSLRILGGILSRPVVLFAFRPLRVWFDTHWNVCRRVESVPTKAPIKQPVSESKFHYFCCGASVASEQQHKQDLRRIYKRENESSKSSLFTRMLCDFLPECIAPYTRVHCATNNTRLWHRCGGLRFFAWIAVETG